MATRATNALLATLLGVLILGGCTAIGTRKREDALVPTVELYLQSLRWGSYHRAAALLRTRGAPPPAIPWKRLRRVRVTDYDYRLVALGPDEVLMKAELHYYTDDDTEVRETTQDAKWWYDMHDQRWFLDAGLPSFGS